MGDAQGSKKSENLCTAEVDMSSFNPEIKVSTLGLAVYTLLLGWSDLTGRYVPLINACRSTVIPVM